MRRLRYSLSRTFSTQAAKYTSSKQDRSDHLAQAELWTNNKTLWYIVKSVSQAQPRPPPIDPCKQMQREQVGKAHQKDTQDIVDANITSLVHEIRHHHDRGGVERQDLYYAYKDLSRKLGDANQAKDSQEDLEIADKYYKNFCTDAHLGVGGDEPTIRAMIQLVLKLVDRDIRRKHETKRQGCVAREVHPLLTLFKLHMYLQARCRLRHRHKTQQTADTIDELPEDDVSVMRNYTGPVGIRRGPPSGRAAQTLEGLRQCRFSRVCSLARRGAHCCWKQSEDER